MRVTNAVILAGVSLGVMTGTDLAIGKVRSSLELVSPIDVVNGSELETTGLANVESLLNHIPSLSRTGDGGSATVDLRGIGNGDRTLVFVNGRRFVAGGGIGHHGDPTNNGSDGTEFADIQLLAGHVFDVRKGKIGVTAGLNLVQWGDDLENGDGDDTTYDINLAYAAIKEFSPSFALNSAAQLHYGDDLSLEAGALKSGVQMEEVFNWSTRTTADYRFNGALGEAGLEFSTYYGTVGYLESGSDERDSISYTIGQEFRYNLNDSTAVFVGGELGTRDYEQWDPFDSDTWRAFGGVRTDGNGWTADATVGFQSIDYDDRDGKDGFTAQIGYTRDLSDRLRFVVDAKYGTQEVFANVGGSDLVDPRGVFFGSSLVVVINEAHQVALTCNVMDVDSEFSSEDFSRESLGIDWSWQVNDTLTIKPSVLWTDYDGVGTDDSIAARFGVYRTF